MKADLAEVVDLYAPASVEGPTAPPWYDEERGRIDEVAFCEDLIARHPMKYIQGSLYDLDGVVDEDMLRREIFEAIRDHAKTGLAKKVTDLIKALKDAAYCTELAVDTDRIHFKNGTYTLLDRSFTEEKAFCLNRLPVRYDPDAARPVRWIAFLNELLYPEDIPALQEYLGYTFIPTNKAQAMMLILGNGGEGKSRIALILRSLLGNNMTNYKLQKLATDRFARGDQVGKLLMVDDDIKTEALPDTSILKTIVTLEDEKYDIEVKGKQSFQGSLYVRVLALGNGALSSLYDKSDGFYRRQLVIRVKTKDEERVDDRNLIDKLRSETEGILLWCLEGLHRLIDQEYQFSVSERMKDNLDEIKRSDNNVIDFLVSDGYICFEKGALALSKDLFAAYCRWCDDNMEKAVASKTFGSVLKREQDRMGIKYVKNVPAGGEKKARGFRGVFVKNPDKYRGF